MKNLFLMALLCSSTAFAADEFTFEVSPIEAADALSHCNKPISVLVEEGKWIGEIAGTYEKVWDAVVKKTILFQAYRKTDGGRIEKAAEIRVEFIPANVATNLADIKGYSKIHCGLGSY